MTNSAIPAGGSGKRSVFDRWGRRGTAIVLSLLMVVMLLIGATAGLALSNNVTTAAPTTSTPPGVASVDVGFMRDMIVHHEQGVLLAHIVQGNGGNSTVAGLAYDIEYTQTAQIGQMTGFLSLWDYSLNSLDTPMAWMTDSSGHSDMTGMSAGSVDAAAAADGAIMPGMATNTQIAALKTLRGQASDILFLQLMIRHHQGGIPMMDYAVAHVSNPVVRNMATKMSESQALEITSMTQLLATYGAVPMPAPGPSGNPSATSSVDSSSPAATTGSTDPSGTAGPMTEMTMSTPTT